MRKVQVGNIRSGTPIGAVDRPSCVMYAWILASGRMDSCNRNFFAKKWFWPTLGVTNEHVPGVHGACQ